MSQKQFISLVLGVNGLFVLLMMYHTNDSVGFTYQMQEYDKEYSLLVESKEALEQHIYYAQSRVAMRWLGSYDGDLIHYS